MPHEIYVSEAELTIFDFNHQLDFGIVSRADPNDLPIDLSFSTSGLFAMKKHPASLQLQSFLSTLVLTLLLALVGAAGAHAQDEGDGADDDFVETSEERVEGGYTEYHQDDHSEGSYYTDPPEIFVDDDGKPLSPEEVEKKRQEYRQWMAQQAEERKQKGAQARALRLHQQRLKEEREKARVAPETPKVETTQVMEKWTSGPKTDEEAEAGPDPETLKAVQSWYARWSPKSQVFIERLKAYSQLSMKRKTEKSMRVCQNLVTFSAELTSDESMRIPDSEAQEAFSSALGSFNEAGILCIGGRFEESKSLFTTGKEQLRTTLVRLKFFNTSL